MTTEVGKLRVEARALIAFGVERYEDAVVYAAIRHYLLDVGGIPPAAWGTLPDVSNVANAFTACTRPEEALIQTVSEAPPLVIQASFK